MSSLVRVLAVFLLLSTLAFAQQSQSTSPAPKKFVPPSVRLKQAKTVYVKNGGGSDIPFNVIDSGIEGWARYTRVDDPAKADLIIEVTAPVEDSGVSVTSKSSSDNGRMEQSTKSTRELNFGAVKLTVYDARNNVPLWSATDQPKSGFKQKKRDDNLVESAQKLLRQFRERVEPEVAQ
jgi:hypothetical protein